MTTKKRIEDLKKVVAQLEAEALELEGRISKARGDVMSAEREYRMSEKLTPAMVDVLARLANREALYSSNFRLPESYWTDNEEGHPHSIRTVRRSIFDGLRSREAIDAGERDGTWRRIYRITDHGRSLLPDPPESK